MWCVCVAAWFAVGCGRIGFDSGTALDDAANSDAANPDAGGQAQVAYVRSTSSTCTAVTTCASTTALDAGNVALVVITYEHTGATVTGLNDDAGNVYVQRIPATTWLSYRTELWIAKDSTAASPVTIATTISQAAPNIWLYVAEYVAVDVDQVAIASGNSIAMSSGTAITTAPDEVIFGHGEGFGIQVMPGSGFTTRLVNFLNLEADKPAPSIGAYDASFELSTAVPWLALMATLR